MKYRPWGRILAERFPSHDDETAEREWSVATQRLSLGQTVTGSVVAKAPFCVWLDIGVGFPAILEINYMAGMTAEVYQADTWCPVGSEVSAFVEGFKDDHHQVYLWQVRPEENDPHDSDRTFIGGNLNPLKHGVFLRDVSGDGPDPGMIHRAAEILGRKPFYIDSNGFECEMFAATVNPDGQRIVYVESRAKEQHEWVDIAIQIHFRDSHGAFSSVDIESYNPYFGCDVGFLNWINDDIAVLIYSEKHRTYAYRIGDQWPPLFAEIEERQQRRLVEAWATMPHEELLADWQRLQAGNFHSGSPPWNELRYTI